MENASPFIDDDQAAQLDQLRSDRHALADRLRAPRWFAPGLGLVAAVVVASPVTPEGTGRNALLLAALTGGVALSSAYHRTTGVRLSGLGALGALIYTAVIGLTLLLLSVSFGLVAGGLHWWVVASAGAALGLVTFLARLFVAGARDRVRHGL